MTLEDLEHIVLSSPGVCTTLENVANLQICKQNYTATASVYSWCIYKLGKDTSRIEIILSLIHGNYSILLTFYPTISLNFD